MNRGLLLMVTVLGVLFLTAIPGHAWLGEVKGMLGLPKGVSELPLPEVTIATFAGVPPAKKVTPSPKLKDSATTPDKAVNHEEVMSFLRITLSETQKKFLEENKFLLLPANAAGEAPTGPEDPCAPPWDEMLSRFDSIGGGWSPVERSPENARFITPDVVLHAFHKFFSNSLKYLEKHDLAKMLRTFVQKTQAAALHYKEQSSGKLAGHYELIAAQITVPLILMENARWEEP